MRHAFMIITHGNFEILEKQLRFLDSENADIFIHVDAKVEAFDFERFAALTVHSAVYFADRVRVTWGDYSQIQSELNLLRAAAAGHYDYYHLLSGVDVPVKPRAYIEEYFTRHPGRNYLCFQNPTIDALHLERVKYYYPLQKLNVRNKKLRFGIRMATAAVQKLLAVDRTRHQPDDIVWQKGTNWFSITHELAEYVLSREDWIADTFRSTCCCDEIFLHTLAASSHFRDTLPPDPFQDQHHSCCRYIDWTRGRPYTFRDSDLEELLRTDGDYLFARKFDYKTAPGVVDALFDHFGE